MIDNKINGRTPEEIKKGQSFSEYLDEKLSKVKISSLEDEDQEQKKRTPEETKKGLSLCYADVCDCSECPYFNMEDCDKQLAADVLMLFQQLERERDAAVDALCKIDEILIKHNFTGTHGCMNEVRKTINDSLIGIICSRAEVESNA